MFEGGPKTLSVPENEIVLISRIEKNEQLTILLFTLPLNSGTCRTFGDDVEGSNGCSEVVIGLDEVL